MLFSLSLSTLMSNSFFQRSSHLLQSLLNQVQSRIQTEEKVTVDQRLENIIITLAYLAVELPDRCQVRTEEFFPDLQETCFILLDSNRNCESIK